MKPTLMILAAGMGSRYGGLKQLDPMGPSGETILDYSVFDAARAGFGRIVFVIRRDFEKEFREKVGRNYENSLQVDYVFQQLDVLPEGFSVPAGREKPWGTTHAIWCAADAVNEPFAAINADDFYGAEAYRAMAGFFKELPGDSASPLYAMAGFRLGKTLSEHGTVSRGVCVVKEDGSLRKIEEFTAIAKTDSGAKMDMPNGETVSFAGDEPVSMNFWGFTPSIFPLIEQELIEFWRESQSNLKSECYIPNTVGSLIDKNKASVRVLPTDSEWFGVTYREDKPQVTEALRRLHASGDYPDPLWKR